MSTLLLVAVLLAGIVVLTPLADRTRLPLPVLLTVFGLMVPLVPGVPALSIEPDVILPVVLPPLLFAATQRSTAREFRANARPILLLAVGLTVVTAAVVAVVAHWLGLGWAEAWVLGAVVAPPDPVAATAVARRLKLPDRLVTLLEGEGMFNDATALVLYSVAVLAVVTGGLSTADVAFRLVLAVVGGIAIGLVAGEVTRRALAALHDPTAETTVTVAVPFAVYLLAEGVHGSGVLAVLTLGLFLRSYAHPALTSAGWLLGRAVWGYADYVITSIVFVLIGFELTAVLEDSSLGGAAAELAAAVVVTVVAVRFLWTFPAAALARSWRRRRDLSSPYGLSETAVVSWAGMRGVVTVATALALPTVTDAGRDVPHRSQIVVAGLVTVLVTLVVQGLTLPSVVRLLGVGAEGDPGREVTELRLRAARAGLQSVQRSLADGELPEPVQRAAVAQYEGYLKAQQALQGARSAEEEQDMSRQLSEVLRRASEAERTLVLDVRRRGEVSAAAADEVLQDIENRALRDIE